MNKKEVILILHNIRSAYNVGSIFRTADGVGVSKIYLCGITPTPRISKSAIRPTLDPRLFAREFSSGRISDLLENGKIEKTALGAEKNIPWEHWPQTWRLLEKLKEQKVKIIALEQSKKSVDYRKFKAKFPLALILGNEVKGLSKKVLKYCDKVIEIPMRGKKESLNVSVAAGVALYRLNESRTKSRPRASRAVRRTLGGLLRAG